MLAIAVRPEGNPLQKNRPRFRCSRIRWCVFSNFFIKNTNFRFLTIDNTKII
nr:MAG TPA: outer membrane protein [Caudoviricetes sp.]